MKKHILILLALAHLGLFGQNTLKVTIADIQSDKGQVRIAVFNNKESFPTPGKYYKAKLIRAQSGRVVVDFADLPAGEYVVMAFHDEDADGEMDKNFIGLPSEGFGYSIKGEPAFRPPVWEKGVFRIPGTTEILVRLVY